jgi:hypothetical protein
MGTPQDAARQLFAAGEPWWADVLIEALDREGPGIAMEWVLRCVAALLPHARSEHRPQLLADLRRLAAQRAEGVAREALWRWAEDVWYRPGRDPAQTAVAKLIWAAGCEFGERPDSWPIHVRAPVALLVGGSARPEDALEACIAEFKALVGKPGKSGS